MAARRPVPPAEEGAQAPHRPPALQAPESLNGRAVSAPRATRARFGSRRLLGSGPPHARRTPRRSEEHTSELQSLAYLVCRLLLEKKKKKRYLSLLFIQLPQ